MTKSSLASPSFFGPAPTSWVSSASTLGHELQRRPICGQHATSVMIRAGIPKASSLLPKDHQDHHHIAMSIEWWLYSDGIRHHTPTPDQHAAPLERLWTLRNMKPILRATLAVLDTQMALLTNADVLRDIYRESYFPGMLSLVAGAQDNFDVLCIFTLSCMGIFVLNKLVIRENS